MIRFGARVSLIFIALALALAAIRIGMPGTPANEPRLAVLDPGRCPMPCWLGIRPGVTTMREAVRLLIASPYVTDIAPLGVNNGISFSAHWKTPDTMLTPLRTDTTDLTISVEGGVDDKVHVIFMHINVPLGDFVMRFGPPARTGLTFETVGSVFYVLEYPELGMQYSLMLECRRGQQLATAYGSVYVLQALSGYVTQVSSQVNIGWHGFDNHDLDKLAKDQSCP